MEEIEQLLAITENLRQQYGLGFALGGNLVGDLGEVLASEKYGLTLLGNNTPTHDAQEIITGRMIQIKSSMQNRSYFPCRHAVPDYYIAIQILPNGELDEIFNGPGNFIVENYINARGLVNNGQYVYTLSGNILRSLNNQVEVADKIQVA